jgi:hypothetical protein
MQDRVCQDRLIEGWFARIHRCNVAARRRVRYSPVTVCYCGDDSAVDWIVERETPCTPCAAFRSAAGASAQVKSLISLVYLVAVPDIVVPQKRHAASEVDGMVMPGKTGPSGQWADGITCALTQERHRRNARPEGWGNLIALPKPRIARLVYRGVLRPIMTPSIGGGRRRRQGARVHPPCCGAAC